jgi:hypothetical protein
LATLPDVIKVRSLDPDALTPIAIMLSSTSFGTISDAVD